MNTYRVIHQFADLQDNNHIYNPGDKFPRASKKRVSNARLEELSTDKNKIGVPLIEKEDSDVVE